MEIWYICKYSWFDPVLSKKPTWFADELYWCQFIVEHTFTICADALIHMHWATMTWIRSENIFFLYPVRLSVNSSCVQLLTEQPILIQAGSKTDGSLASSDACTSDASLLWQTLTLAHAWWIIITMCMMIVLIVRRKMVIGGDWPWQTADGPLAQPLPPHWVLILWQLYWRVVIESTSVVDMNAKRWHWMQVVQMSISQRGN